MLSALRTRLGQGAAARAAETAAAQEPEADHHGEVTLEVEFAAYAEDCRIFGFWRHGAERMSDALNAAEEYVLHDVLVSALGDAHTTEAREFVVRRDELLAVRASGARGNAARRSRVRPSPVTLGAGPYTIHGYVHAPPGADPIRQIRRRKPMVPLTETWMEYTSAGQLHRARVGILVVNMVWVDWVRMSRDEEVRLPGLPAEAALDPRAKDLTGYIHTGVDTLIAEG
jgi:hypothetical protein